jgi:hypothetical protein
MLVHFKFEGIFGVECIPVESTGIDAYKEAVDKFWEMADDSGARVIESARSAWDYIPIVHGPKLLFVQPKKV